MAETIYQSILETAKRYPDKTALMYKKQGQYLGITYKELNNLVDAVAAMIQGLGIKKGDIIGIFSNNRPEWTIADLAVLKQGGVVVPIYYNLPPSCLKYIINDSKIRLIFVENSELFALIDSIRNETPDLKKIILFDATGVSSNKDFLKFDDTEKTGHRAIDKGAVISNNDIATIVYTSGTTGEPKGVILTNDNIVSNILSIINRFKIAPDDIIVSYLPLCNMFERTCCYTLLFAGGTIGYAENLSTIAQDVAEIRPTLLIAVPRIIEKAYDMAVEKVEKSSPIKKALVLSAIKNLNKYANLKYKNMKISPWLKIKYSIYNRLVASKFREIAGGRLRLIISGSAPLNPQIEKIFYILGFNIIEGYGLTETSPVVCTNLIEDNRLGTVGKPIDDVEIKIGDGDEILVKGPNVMKGYLNKPEETARVIDSNGWFHTGDQGRFDAYGNLIITGRIKEIIVTSYGKNIAPAPLEEKISRSRYIDQVMLHGDKRKYIVALIVPNRESIEHYAGEKNILSGNYSELLETDKIKELINHEIEKATTNLASYEKVKTFALLSEGFTVENGMFTLTLKLRRGEIAKRYVELINALYENLEKKNEN
ncbi:long-chain fatty acid--CoA ligase [candidate division WOR-3 bacterium]|nr:long-chain fatty acid--CoA ligase [candidate division WOR-3 bacterium]